MSKQAIISNYAPKGTIPLPVDGQMGLLVTVESSEFTIGKAHLRV